MFQKDHVKKSKAHYRRTNSFRSNKRDSFRLLGNVRRPGVYGLVRCCNLTIRSAVAAAGGVWPKVGRFVCEITRGQSLHLECELDSPIADLDEQTLIHAGDVIQVRPIGKSKPPLTRAPATRQGCARSVERQ